MPTRKKSSKGKRILGGAIGTGCLFTFLCGFGGFLVIAKLFREDSTRLPSDLELAHERGLPVTAADIRTLTPPLPESENAAPLYREANKEFKKIQRVNFRINGRRPSSADWRRQAKRNTEAFEPTLEILKKAAKLPGCDFKDDLEHGYVTSKGLQQPFQDQFSFGGISQAIVSGAQYRLDMGQTDQALDEISILIQMTRQTSPFAPMFSGSWKLYAESGIVRVLFRTLDLHASEPLVVERVEQLSKLIDLPDFYKSIEMEFVLGRATIHSIKSFKDLGLDKNTPEIFNETVDSLYQSPGVKEAFDGKYMRTYLTLFSNLPKDHDDWQAIHAALVKMRKQLDDDHSLDSGVNRILTPAYPNMVYSYATTQAEIRMLADSISLVKQHAASGRFPAELPPQGQDSIDPFTNKPLRYHQTDSGFIIYSVGRNLRDDGGIRWRGNKQVGDDIAFRFIELGNQNIVGERNYPRYQGN